MLNKLRHKVITFIDSKKEIPILAALAAGLYPLIYYYNENFTLVNSWPQFFYFVLTYLALPSIAFYFIYALIKKGGFFNKHITYVIPILNSCLFAFLIVISTYGYRRKILLLGVLIAFILAVLLKKYFKKIVVFQLILAILVFIKVTPFLYDYFAYSGEWINQPDDIEQVKFKNKPNIYVIQPDGYANFSELKNKTYNFDNSEFESYLTENNFKLYDNFRSNYYSTLSSNSSMFAMTHHQYSNPKLETKEFYNARDIIVGANPVVSILKKNDYKTFLILEKPYLIVNRPKLGFDYCNITYDELSYLDRGFGVEKNTIEDLEKAIVNNTSTINFYFIEKLIPGHIPTFDWASKGKEDGRIGYLKKLRSANDWLKEIIKRIERHDPNSLIVIVADHGGYVGLDYSLQCKEKKSERDLVYTIFTSALAIHWPDNAPHFDHTLKTNVNLFRILFSYLSEDEKYLDHLQEDKSYSVIETGAPFGVYELINEKGEVVFNKFSK